MAKIDGRTMSGNNPLSVLCRLAGEVSYVRERLCIRNADDYTRSKINEAYFAIDAAINYLNTAERDGGANG